MNIQTLQKLIWVLIYGGLLLLCFGIAVQRREAGVGQAMMLAGGAVAAVGFALIYVRSRMKKPD